MHCVCCMYTIYELCMLYVCYMLEMGTNRKTGFLGSLSKRVKVDSKDYNQHFIKHDEDNKLFFKSKLQYEFFLY